jgi:hypothetical protein
MRHVLLDEPQKDAAASARARRKPNRSWQTRNRGITMALTATEQNSSYFHQRKIFADKRVGVPWAFVLNQV